MKPIFSFMSYEENKETFIQNKWKMIWVGNEQLLFIWYGRQNVLK